MRDYHRRLHCYLVKCLHTHTFETICVYIHHWYCYLPVGVHCKPLRHGELYCLYSLTPLSQQGRPGDPHWHVHTHKCTHISS